METEIQALARIEKMTPVQLFVPGAIDPILEQIKKEVLSIVTDISTEQGRKSVASLAFKVARSKTFVDEQRKSLVSEEKKRLAAIDKEGKRIWEELESLQKEVRKPLTDWENLDKERMARHEMELAEIREAGPYTLQNWQTLPLEAMQERLKEIKSIDRNWEEFSERAKFCVMNASAEIERAIQQRIEFDTKQAELEKLRKVVAERQQKERDEMIAKEAAGKAQREADERVAKAERDAAQAVERERQRVEAEKQAELAAQAKREANRKHVAKVNSEAASAFTAVGFDKEAAKSIVELIAKGEVPHVRIEY